MSHQPIELHAIDMGNHDDALGKCGIQSARVPFDHFLGERVDHVSTCASSRNPAAPSAFGIAPVGICLVRARPHAAQISQHSRNVVIGELLFSLKFQTGDAIAAREIECCTGTASAQYPRTATPHMNVAVGNLEEPRSRLPSRARPATASETESRARRRARTSLAQSSSERSILARAHSLSTYRSPSEITAASQANISRACAPKSFATKSGDSCRRRPHGADRRGTRGGQDPYRCGFRVVDQA